MESSDDDWNEEDFAKENQLFIQEDSYLETVITQQDGFS